MLQERKKPTFAQKLNVGVGKGLEYGEKLMQEHQKKQEENKQYNQENEQYQKMTGRQLSKNPAIRKMEIESALKGEEQKNKFEQEFKNAKELQKEKYGFEDQLKGKKPNKEEVEKKENFESLNSALDALGQMRQLRQKGNLGRGSAIWGLAGGDTARDRGEYQTLGNSLIQFASNIPIRNRQEFEKLAGHLGDPSISDSESQGILDGMERIIRNSMKKYSGEEQESMSSSAGLSAGKKRPPLSSFQK